LELENANTARNSASTAYFYRETVHVTISYNTALTDPLRIFSPICLICVCGTAAMQCTTAWESLLLSLWLWQ
jgi:hypothetical protein